MFYFLVEPILMYNWVLILAAIIPAIFLMIKVYKSDRIEKESGYLLRQLVTAGIIATLLALIEERVGEWILSCFVEQNSLLYQIILYFGIVAFSEESSKYILLKRKTWDKEEFNCQYDGIVYAVFVSLGFALWENINYVLSYGFSTAIVRALTAIPGHACFGVFMGIFYGLARKYRNYGHPAASKIMRIFCILMPALLHGAYDFIASMESVVGGWYFAGFVVILFIVSFALVNCASKKDQYI
mgnify:FL=1